MGISRIVYALVALLLLNNRAATAQENDKAEITAAVTRSLTLLQASGRTWIEKSGCVSCHHQALPAVSVALARARGFRLDEEAARATRAGHARALCAGPRRSVPEPVGHRHHWRRGIGRRLCAVGSGCCGCAAERHDRRDGALHYRAPVSRRTLPLARSRPDAARGERCHRNRSQRPRPATICSRWAQRRSRQENPPGAQLAPVHSAARD